MASVISGDANVSATEFGYLDGVTSALQTQMDAKLPIAGGKILQIVRATDTTLRSTTSTSFVDITGMSVTITPQKSDSAILLIATYYAAANNSSIDSSIAVQQITDSSNNAISGAQECYLGVGGFTRSSTVLIRSQMVMIGYATPATTSATTYKVRAKTTQATTTLFVQNNLTTGQMYAIEVSA